MGFVCPWKLIGSHKNFLPWKKSSGKHETEPIYCNVKEATISGMDCPVI